MKIDSIISCAAPAHLNVWKYTSKYLLKYISAESYTVLVPPSDVELFKENTPPRFNVLNEEEIVPKEFKTNKWVYQQFLKIECARLSGQRTLIWDGDTVPLKGMSDIFFPNETDIQVFYADEHTLPYFNTIKNLLDIPNRLVDFSFISQCLPVYSADIELLKNTIEKKHKKNWFHAIQEASQRNRFSEYETIGNFVVQKKLRDVKLFRGKWSRAYHSQRVQKYLDIDELTEKDLYYASFETTSYPPFFWMNNPPILK